MKKQGHKLSRIGLLLAVMTVIMAAAGVSVFGKAAEISTEENPTETLSMGESAEAEESAEESAEDNSGDNDDPKEYVSWEALQDAINGGKEKAFILAGNVVASASVTKPLTFGNDATYVLDLNGFTLNRAKTSADIVGQVIVIEKGATLIVKDSSGTNQGRITGGYAQNNGAGIYAYGTLVFEGGTITGNKSGSKGGGIYSEGGSVKISGGVIEGNKANEYGGGIFAANGTLIMTGGAVRNNTSSKSGAGIHINSCTAEIADVEILNNTSMTSGGGLVVTNHSACTMSNVSFVGNSAVKGGAIWLNDQSTLDADGLDLRSNLTSGVGAAIYVVNSNGTVSHSSFTDNEGDRSENGEVCTESGKLNLIDCTGNSAKFYGTWADLKAAIANAPDGEPIRISLNDNLFAYSEDTYIEVPAGKNIILNLAGHQIARNLTAPDFNGHVIVIRQGGTLTVIDSSGDNSGQITGGYAQNNGGGIYVIGTLNLESGSIIGNRCGQMGAGIYIKGGTVNINGGLVTNNESGSVGGGIYCCEKGTLNIRGGTYSKNTAANHGGAIYVCEGSVLTFTSGTVTDNTAKYGGGIYLNSSTINIENALVTRNTASVEGGGLYFASGSANLLTESTIRGNYATERGGGIGVGASASLTMTDCTLTGNSVKNDGGGVFTSGPLVMEKCTLTENEAKAGGGIGTASTTVTMTDCIISRNGASEAGGCLFASTLASTGAATLTDCTITENKAFSTGGGIEVFGNTTLLMTGCMITKNQAETEGGGICAKSGSFAGYRTLTADRCEFSENTAKTGGAMSLAVNTRIMDSLIEGNRATGKNGTASNVSGHGGGAYLPVPKGILIRFDRTDFLNNTAESDGGAIYANGDGDLVFHECNIKKNHADSEVGGLMIGNVRLAFLGADIEENTAYQRCGGIMVTHTAVSMKGWVVINNNTTETGPVELRDMQILSGSYIENPGLYAGSYIHIGSETTTVDTVYARDISKYQMKYFHIDSDSVKFTETSKVKSPIVASLFGGTAMWFAIGVAGALAAAGVIAVVLKKRKGGKNNGEAK